MEAVTSPEMFVPIYQSTRCHQKKATFFDRSCLRRGFKPRKEVTENSIKLRSYGYSKYEGRTESHEQLCFACELGTADEGDCGGRWNQLLCYP